MSANHTKSICGKIMSKKRFLLDTNVLMRSPRSIYVFEENDVCICHTTLEELDNLKTRPGDTGFNAREAIRTIKTLRNGGSLAEGITLPGMGKFSIAPDFDCSCNENQIDLLPKGWSFDKPDNRIIATAKSLDAILVTSDISMLIKAESAGVKTEMFRNEQVSEETLKYTGRSTVYAGSDVIDRFYKDGCALISDMYEPQNVKLHVNEFVVLTDVCNPKKTALGYFDGDCICKLRYSNIKPYGVTPKNVGQKFALEALLAPASEIPLVILRGPAGVAKTFLALAAGLEKVINTDEYRKLLIIRPNVKFDDDIGYLKGDEMEKIKPLLRPCIDNLEVLLSTKGESVGETQDRIEDLFEQGILNAEAMAYLRGRSIHNQYLIIEEGQNVTPAQAKGIITRAGMNSKIVIVGDPEQIDHSKLDKRNNGLVYASEKMLGSKLCMQLTFDSSECVRSPLSQEASELL